MVLRFVITIVDIVVFILVVVFEVEGDGVLACLRPEPC